MIDFISLLEVAGSIALLAAPAILLDRWLAGAEGPTLAYALAIPIDPAWPRGVQETEPVRWRVEALTPRTTPPAHSPPEKRRTALTV